MTCDWVKEATQGTQGYYVITNGLVMGSYLLIYSATAMVMLVRRKVGVGFNAC